MIERRPERLQEYLERISVPSGPFSVSWDWVPELVQASFLPLSGIQPITSTMFRAAGGPLWTAPTDGEIDYFRSKGTRFQMIQLVMSLAWWKERDGGVSGVPYAISVLPASKRGTVTDTDIDYIAALQGAPVDHSTEVYGGFNPFTGSWSIYSSGADYLAVQAGNGFIDEVGIVMERYFLANDFDEEDVLECDSFLPDERSRRAYRRNRIKKLFKPFKKVCARRIWGLDSPIELFLLQELLFRGLRPECQYLIYPGSECYPSLYNVYADVEFRRSQNILSEVDFFFPGERVAVFCDGAYHQRAKQASKDERIVKCLANLGIKAVRVPSRLINEDLEQAGELVCTALGL